MWIQKQAERKKILMSTFVYKVSSLNRFLYSVYDIHLNRFNNEILYPFSSIHTLRQYSRKVFLLVSLIYRQVSCSL